MVNNQAVAGWYPNPEQPGTVRYWDGAAWTSHTRAAEFAAPAPAPAASGQYPNSGEYATIGQYAGPSTQISSDPFVGSAGLSPAEAAVAGRGIPWWSWVLIALVAAAGIAWAITSLPSLLGDDGPATYSTWETPNGIATFDVSDRWREDTATAAEENPAIAPVLTGAWYADGRPFALSNVVVYAMEYPDQAEFEDMDLADIGEEYYSNWGVEFVIESTSSETFTTAKGYEGWKQYIVADDDGFEVHTIQVVLRHGVDELNFIIYRYDDFDSYEDELDRLVDSVVFTKD